MGGHPAPRPPMTVTEALELSERFSLDDAPSSWRNEVIIVLAAEVRRQRYLLDVWGVTLLEGEPPC